METHDDVFTQNFSIKEGTMKQYTLSFMSCKVSVINVCYDRIRTRIRGDQTAIISNLDNDDIIIHD